MRCPGSSDVHARRPSSAVHRHPDMRLQHVFHPHRSAGQPPPGGHLLGPPREDGGRCRPGWRHQAAPIRAIRRRMRPAPRDAASGSGSGAVRPASSPARRAGGPLCRLCRDLSHADLHVRADRTESLRSQMCVVDRRAAGSAWSSRFRGTTSAVRRLRKFEMQDDPGFAGWSPGSRQGWWRSLPARGRPSGVVQPVNAAELRGRSGVLIRSTSAIWARGE